MYIEQHNSKEFINEKKQIKRKSDYYEGESSKEEEDNIFLKRKKRMAKFNKDNIDNIPNNNNLELIQ